jgi:prevent-host-death family protein
MPYDCEFGNITKGDRMPERCVSVYDARARFAELVERAEGGRSTVITKRGRIVARIVPARQSAWDRSAVLDEAEALRRSLKVRKRVNLAVLLGTGRP